MSEKTRYLFVYGTLMVPEVVRRLLGHELEMRSAKLPGYQRFRVADAVYPGIIEGREEDSVSGQLLSGMSTKGWDTLDIYEGDEYTRRAVEVIDASGAKMIAQAYVFKDARFLTDEPWDDSEVLNQLKDLGL